MVIHKKTRLTPIQGKQLTDDYFKQRIRVCDLKRKYLVSTPTAYKILHRSRDNEKAEKVIRTLLEMWHEKTLFKNRLHRKLEIIRFVNFYNTVKPHKGIKNKTPLEKLVSYFYPKSV